MSHSSATTSVPTPARLRIIGDPVLHSPGMTVPAAPTPQDMAELEQQIALARQLLIQTGGLGIAANQCADIAKPYRFAIVGVYHEVAEHVAHTKARYPDLIFPQARLMLNPEVIAASEEMQPFRHGCLSIPGGLRAEILTPKSMTISYLTYEHGHFIHQQETYVDVAAVILQHELNHINAGLTYFDCCLTALSKADRSILSTILDNAVSHLGHVDIHAAHFNTPQVQQSTSNKSTSAPAFYRIVSIDQHGHSIFHPDILTQALAEHPHLVTCLGLQQRLRIYQ